MATRPKPRKPRNDRLEPDEKEQKDNLTELLEEIGGSGFTIKLYRRNDRERPRRWDYVDTVSLTPELVEDVKSQYGGGAYRGAVSNAKGEYQKGRMAYFSIEGAPKHDATEPDRLAELEARLIERTATQKNGVKDTVEVVTAIVAALSPLGVALAGLFAKRNDNPGTDVASTVNMLQEAERRGEERGEKLGALMAGGKGDRGDSLGHVAAQYFPEVITLVRENMKRRNAPNVPAVAAPVAVTPAPAAAPGAALVVQSSLPEPYQFLDALRPYYAEIAPHAARDMDPTVIADFALMKMDEPLLLAIQAATLRDDFRQVMRGELAGIGQMHPEWLEEFLSRIIETSKPDIVPVPKKTAKGRANA